MISISLQFFRPFVIQSTSHDMIMAFSRQWRTNIQNVPNGRVVSSYEENKDNFSFFLLMRKKKGSCYGRFDGVRAGQEGG